MSGDALGRQVGGTHYKIRRMQPVEFWQRNRWDGIACTILKHLDRWREKNGLEDLRKARHYTELRQELERYLTPFRIPTEVSMVNYMEANGITEPLDRVVLIRLEAYVHSYAPFRDASAESLIEAIDALIATINPNTV